VATIAIVACSAVAIIAIVIFLVTLLNGGLGGAQQLVQVPNLLGKNYDTLQVYNNLVIAEPKYSHDDTYEKGRVMTQNPKGGEMVAKGTEITITVSLGPVPQARIMENLVGQKQKVAENYLDGQGILFLCEEEHDSDIEAGKVCRTEPKAGEPIADGQTVTLYISLGSAIKTQNMPDLIDQNVKTAKMILDMQDLDLEIVEEEEENDDIAEGNIIRTEPLEGEELKTGDTVTLYVSTGPKKATMLNVIGESVNTAKKLLSVAGFTGEITIEEVDSDKPKDQVVEQSVKADEETAVNTPIVLKVSKGPSEVTKQVTFGLVEGMVDPYTVWIEDEAGNRDEYEITDGRDSIIVLLKGSGKKTYKVYINGEYFMSQEVDFDK